MLYVYIGEIVEMKNIDFAIELPIESLCARIRKRFWCVRNNKWFIHLLFYLLISMLIDDKRIFLSIMIIIAGTNYCHNDYGRRCSEHARLEFIDIEDALYTHIYSDALNRSNDESLYFTSCICSGGRNSPLASAHKIYACTRRLFKGSKPLSLAWWRITVHKTHSTEIWNFRWNVCVFFADEWSIVAFI